MGNKNLVYYVSVYKEQLAKGEIQIAYESLLKYVKSLKTDFENRFFNQFSIGNVSPGYMDFTYFPFFNPFLREKKLRFGIVLNHQKMQFELWLMGQNAEVQSKYWELLKSAKWNGKQNAMPRYSVLETVLVEKPNFDDLEALTRKINESAFSLSNEIISHIKTIQ